MVIEVGQIWQLRPDSCYVRSHPGMPRYDKVVIKELLPLGVVRVMTLTGKLGHITTPALIATRVLV